MKLIFVVVDSWLITLCSFLYSYCHAIAVKKIVDVGEINESINQSIKPLCRLRFQLRWSCCLNINLPIQLQFLTILVWLWKYFWHVIISEQIFSFCNLYDQFLFRTVITKVAMSVLTHVISSAVLSLILIFHSLPVSMAWQDPSMG